MKGFAVSNTLASWTEVGVDNSLENFLLMLYFVVMTDTGEGSQTGKEKTEKQKTSNSQHRLHLINV